MPVEIGKPGKGSLTLKEYEETFWGDGNMLCIFEGEWGIVLKIIKSHSLEHF